MNGIDIKKDQINILYPKIFGSWFVWAGGTALGLNTL